MADSKITFKDIEKANSTIKPMQISRWDKKQGREITKDYAEVNQRIRAFRMVYPDGFIITDIISHSDGIIVMQAKAGYYLENGDAQILGTGTAFEDKKNGMINGTSYIENCETSAVGRALGMIGLGIDMSIASYEEVKNAMAQQEAPTPAPKKQATAKKAVCTCQRCGNPIQPSNGYEVHQIVANTRKQFGMDLCFDCARAEKAEREAAQNQLPFPIDQ